jgi:signal transduction histidine kinase
MRASELFRTATFRLAVFFALAVSVSTAVVFLFIYWRVATFDVERLDAILVREVARAVTQPEDRVKRELELRFTSDLRRLDYAALFDNTGKLQYGNVAVIPKDLPIDGAAHIVEAPPLRSTGTGTEPAVFVAGRRQDGGSVLLDLDQALATVTALLRITEIESVRRRSGFTRVDLAQVCTNVFELYEPLAEAKPVAFTLDAPSPLPVRGDFELLVEAIANLVDNAIKNMDIDQVRPRHKSDNAKRPPTTSCGSPFGPNAA